MVIHIETDHLLIRNFTIADTSDLHDILGDDETMKNCEAAYDFQKTSEFMETFCVGRSGALAAVEKQSQKVIGYIIFSPLEPGVHEMGWIFNRNYWRQGYAYEACKSVIDLAFQEYTIQKVIAETIDPIISVGLMKKLGMMQDSVQSSYTVDRAGNQAELYCYSILREDWEKQ